MYKNMHIMRVSYDPDGLKNWNSYATASSLGHFEGPAKNEKVDTVTRYNVVLRSRSCCRSKKRINMHEYHKGTSKVMFNVAI